MLKLSRSQNLILVVIIAGLEVGKPVSTLLLKTEQQSKIIIYLLWKLESPLFVQKSGKIFCQVDLYKEFSFSNTDISSVGNQLMEYNEHWIINCHNE